MIASVPFRTVGGFGKNDKFQGRYTVLCGTVIEPGFNKEKTTLVYYARYESIYYDVGRNVRSNTTENQFSIDYSTS